MKTINLDKKRYFICRDSKKSSIKAYGVMVPGQYMSTNQQLMQVFLDKGVWITQLSQNGIEY